MSVSFPGRATLLSAALALLLATLPSATTQEATGVLEAQVKLVAADLSVRPVPKQRFLLVAHDPARTLTVTTGFDGAFRQSLTPGSWRIQSEGPIELEGRRFTWDVQVDIVAGGAMSVELSNDNARIEEAARLPDAASKLQAGEVFERYRHGIFKVIADGSHGSGFLVSADGLILTNHHVVADATYIAIRMDEAHKHTAQVLAEDKAHDVVVLRVHPETVAGRPVLPLAEDSPAGPPVAIGATVVAIGSPLTTHTILTEGVISQIQEGSYYSDVSINPGNSGGPLFNSSGLVVGINTFGLQGSSGPGLSGITRIHVARASLETALQKVARTAPPPARALPVESPYRFPPDLVRETALSTKRLFNDYHIEAGKLDIQVLTPMLIASEILKGDREAAEARRKRLKGKEDAGAPEETGQRFYEWQKDQDNFLPVVRVRVFPEIKMSMGSAFMMGMTGTGGRYRFKTDFQRMELWRGGTLIEPIHPGRIKEVVNVEGPAASLKDIGYWGLYEYPPEAFLPGADLTLRVWEQGRPEPHILKMEEALLSRIREDFAPYLKSLPPG